MVKFLVVRFSSMGDMILTTPVLRHLKQQVEGAEVHYLTKSVFGFLLEANPYVDRIHLLDGPMKDCLRNLRKEGFDYLIDLHHNARSARVKFALKRMDFSVRKLNLRKWLLVNFKWDLLPDSHMVDRHLDTIEPFISYRDEYGLDYFIPETDKVPMESLPKPFREGYIALSIGAGHPTKRLPESSLAELCQSLPHPVILLGGKEDRYAGEALAGDMGNRHVLNLCGKYNFHQSASLVEQARLLITHDTGLMHVGAAFGKKIISIWGNTVPGFGMYPYRPDPSSSMFEVHGLPCRPCSKIGYNKCPKGHFRCMVDQDKRAISKEASRLFDPPPTGQ